MGNLSRLAIIQCGPYDLPGFSPQEILPQLVQNPKVESEMRKIFFFAKDKDVTNPETPIILKPDFQ